MKRRLLVVTTTAVKIEVSAPLSKETALRAFPKTRGECEEGIRPCPWVSCRHHLAIEVMDNPSRNRFGSFPPSKRVELLAEWDEWLNDDSAEEPSRSCSLDVADEGEHSAGTIAKWSNVTRQAVENIESRATKKFRLGLAKLRGG